MIEIPKQLQNIRYRFIKLRDGKIPLESEWTTKNNYSFNDVELALWLKGDNNYGVVCGNGLIVIDADRIELKEAVEEGMPETFTVRTGAGHHFYYHCQLNEKIVFNGQNEHWGELQTLGQQVVGAGCLHTKTGRKYEIIKDKPIVDISIEQIRFALRKFMKENAFAKAELKREHKDIDINIVDIADTSGLVRRGNELQGSHPIHNSTGGANFCINDTDNIWHCFRCDSGGGVLQWIAVQEGLIRCEDAKRGCLTGELFRKVLKIAKEKYGLKANIGSITMGDATARLDDYLLMAENFLEVQPLYYDRNRTWWIWNVDKSCWIETDEVDILNKIDEKINTNTRTTRSDVKNEMLEALKRKARLNAPMELKESWVQFKDRLVDIDSGDEIEVSSRYFATNPIPWGIGKTDKTPTLDSFITEWVGKEHLEEIYEYIAFSIVPDYFINRFFFFIGGGNNGKSTLFNVMMKFLGTSNITSAEMDELVNSRFHTYKLYRKLACFMGETDFGLLRKTSILKKLTGKDLIPFEKKHANPFDAINYAKIFIATNTVPETADRTGGWYRRFIDVDFPNDFSNKEKDIIGIIPDEEYENLANKCLKIAKHLYKIRRFTYEKSIKEKEARYESRSNPLTKFIDEECEKGLELNDKLPFFDFYERFSGFLKQKKYRAMSKNEVTKRLRDNGFDTKKGFYKFDEEGKQINILFVEGLKWRHIPHIPHIPSISTLPLIIEKKVENGGIRGMRGMLCHFCGKNTENFITTVDIYNPEKHIVVCDECKKGD